ncbi:Oidioi.mRNA.OKI2018_I69.PAR.g10629.t1.cds [Oikopleura dioica]|uniref:Oidioi.mRNA.OKI2018_I69.PAR.g10629.t1.cds n=1 Tax=Oikopleura dioica TaxID=34765 RepID=A0ABN7RVX1_OIKDI|nr:Oidioi.mRNA.OKI2018_I69.PAR.g10629.t1.cds [Oikopleura dioica]
MLSTDVLKRKLAAVTNTQASINNLSTWIIENKASASQVVEFWLTQLQKSDNDHRLTLLYVANDVIQNCRKRGSEYKELSENWKEVMPRAFDYFSHEAIRSGVDKVLSVWESRTIMDAERIKLLKEKLDNPANNQNGSGKNDHYVEPNLSLPLDSPGSGEPREFLYTDLVEAIREYSKCENELKLKKELLESSGIEGSDPDQLLEKVKERGHGHRARQELEQWTQLLLEYVSLQETAIERRRTLLTVLDQSSGFYETQFREVTTVLKAYKDYQERIIAQKRRCQEMMKAKFPEKATNLTPVQSPQGSPELTIPIMVPVNQAVEMNMSDSASSSEDEALPNSLASFFAPQETPSSSNLSAAGTSGDLDSRLANILNPQQQSTPRPRARASRWDTGEASHGRAPPLPPPQMLNQPRLNTPPNAYGNHAGNEGFNGSVPDWQAPKPPQNQYEMPASWGSPQKQYGQNGQQNMNSGPPRGGFSGGPHRGGYAPRTPQGQRPPRPHFHSEGPYGRGRGGPRGGRGFFTPRGDRGMRRFR